MPKDPAQLHEAILAITRAQAVELAFTLATLFAILKAWMACCF